MTLIGPGGAGKTRLAVETAATLQPEYRDGAWLVELAAVRDPKAVAGAIAATLGAVEPGRRRRRRRRRRCSGSCVSHLRGRSQVIVLDNCEHVVAAAATVVEAMLGEVPGSARDRRPAASRSACPGEALFPIGGLDVDAAVELFADRGRGGAHRRSRSTPRTGPIVAELCRRLDHLPLALELAAARLRVLPLTQLVGLLDDRFRVLTGGSRTALARHQTLRAVVDWSHDLLFDDERRLFARLSVFTGGLRSRRRRVGVRRRRARSRSTSLDLLSRLVDKSLVVAEFDESGDVRYSQLQTLWEYGRERLADSGEADAVPRSPRAVVPVGESRTPVRVSAVSDGLVWRARISRGARQPARRARLVHRARQRHIGALVDDRAGLGLAPTQRLSAGCSLARGRARSEGDASAHIARSRPCVARLLQCLDHGAAAALDEVLPAIEVLRDGSDPQRLVDALLILGELLNRNGDIATTARRVGRGASVLDALGDRMGAGRPRPARRRVSGADGRARRRGSRGAGLGRGVPGDR